MRKERTFGTKEFLDNAANAKFNKPTRYKPTINTKLAMCSVMKSTGLD